MFEKQWFSQTAQEGLCNDALLFEKEISKKNIDRCISIIKKNIPKIKNIGKEWKKG